MSCSDHTLSALEQIIPSVFPRGLRGKNPIVFQIFDSKVKKQGRFLSRSDWSENGEGWRLCAGGRGEEEELRQESSSPPCHPHVGFSQFTKKRRKLVLTFQHLRNYNVFLIGLCFAFIFTGFYTMSQTQVSLVWSFESFLRIRF